MRDNFPQYTTDYITGIMSLRTPQEKSLEILDTILQKVELKKEADLAEGLAVIHRMYPICTDFEREFISLTFALATGVGKTRLMGAFITYLYTNLGIRNFFVVAPSTTIYRKLETDLGDPSSEKYVFRGVGCFSQAPIAISEERYAESAGSTIQHDVRIFIFNIDKFNKEDANMKKVNEFIGTSFYQYVASLPDLVLLMDESHHYRAKRGMAAIDGLHPILGLELTATPLYVKGSKSIKFQNVVYEYPLSKAIEDGYTRTPYAVTRSDIQSYQFGEEQMDKLMLADGILCHERARQKLEEYAHNFHKKPVKPFLLVVCKDTDHAAWVEQYIKSEDFKEGFYRNKTITIHSKQKGAETETNTKLLLEVERYDNPIEIVIHVNMLKEGWDVNNLYTIVPLRTASSQILREQMVGRGLRLPYGERTGEKEVDAVMLTAHDKFQDILEEARRGDSIFKAGNVIRAEDIQGEKITYAQQNLSLERDGGLEGAYAETGLEKSEKNDALLRQADSLIKTRVADTILSTPKHQISQEQEREIAQSVERELSETMDLAAVRMKNELPILFYLQNRTKLIHRETMEKYIPIPRMKITDEGVEEYEFLDFDLDLSGFRHTPVQNALLIQNLEKMQDLERVKESGAIDFEAVHPQREILGLLRKKPEIDYDRCSGQLFKHISAVCEHYEEQYGTKGLKNIVMMHKRELANMIYDQMMQHFYVKNGFLREEVVDSRHYNIRPQYTYKERVGLFSNYSEEHIQNVLFEDIQRGVFAEAKFHSMPELIFARVVEKDKDVKNWLRPAATEFDITYNHGHRYEPDFVVETKDGIYLVEVKGEDRRNNADVVAKKERGIQYCAAASRWGRANGYKPWQYLFIPSQQVSENSSFMYLAERFKELT